MKKKKILMLPLAILLVSLASCGKDDGGNGDGDNVVAGPYAPEVYWSDSYSGPYGFQVGSIASKPGEKRIMLGGVPLYITGVNCYNLFVQSFEADNMKLEEIKQTVKELVDNKVPVVRFSCSPYYPNQMRFYTEQKEQYLSNLNALADLCDQGHILLIPSVFWNTSCVPEYCGESITAWGDKSSKTHAFMNSYLTDIVNTLKGHKCLAGWEFGNEFNLAADIGFAGHQQIPATDVETAYKSFAETIDNLDDKGRLIMSGNSIMRNSQWHQFNQASWSVDSFSQYAEIAGIMTPNPMKGMSEHIYEDAREFSDKGKVNRTYQVYWAKQAAKQLGKVYYIGEFTGPVTVSGDSLKVKAHYSAYLAQKVQLSMVWNYALRGNIEYSFTAAQYEGFPFSMMRRYNDLYKKMKPE